MNQKLKKVSKIFDDLKKGISLRILILSSERNESILSLFAGISTFQSEPEAKRQVND